MTQSCIPVILAGGFGTRIRHLLPDRPKPMAQTCSKPFLSWILQLLADQGFSQAILSTGYKGDFIESFYKDNPIPNINIVCIQEPSPLGTAGGFLNAASHANLSSHSWLVLNGDSLALTNLSHFVHQMHALNTPSGILALHMDDASRYGTLSYSKNNDLIQFSEKKPGSAMINAGIYYFNNDTLSLFPKTSPLSFETDVFPHLLNTNVPVKVAETNAPFIDIGTPDTLDAAADFINSHFATPSS